MVRRSAQSGLSLDLARHLEGRSPNGVRPFYAGEVLEAIEPRQERFEIPDLFDVMFDPGLSVFLIKYESADQRIKKLA